MKNWIKKTIDFMLELVFPARCPVCDGILALGEEKICPDCYKKLRLVTPPWCMKCGKKLQTSAEFCPDCSSRPHQFDRGRVLYEYPYVSAAIYRFKYGNRREYAEFFGSEMAEWLEDFIREASPDVLVPIPLHKKRMRQRGFNQAALLARVIGRKMGIPVEEKLLVRVRNTKPLKLLNLKERQNNLKKAFNMRQNEVKLKRVVLVDDIYTTGSTMDEAARTLRESGVEKIFYLTIAAGVGK